MQQVATLEASRLLLRILALSLLLFLAGCREARSGDMPGKYVLRTDWGESVLILRPDRSMEQEVHKLNGDTKRISGTWQFANSIVTLKPCLVVQLRVEGDTADGCASGVTVTALGTVEISADSNYNISYKKVGRIDAK